MSKNLIKDKSFQFAVEIVKLCRILTEVKKEFVLANQLLKSGTSIGANVREAQNSESKNDFIHKFSIAQKETNETLYWLELLKETNLISDPNYIMLYDTAQQLYKIITSIIVSTKKNKT